jgi:hypothetical protein
MVKVADGIRNPFMNPIFQPGQHVLTPSDLGGIERAAGSLANIPGQLQNLKVSDQNLAIQKQQEELNNLRIQKEQKAVESLKKFPKTALVIGRNFEKQYEDLWMQIENEELKRELKPDKDRFVNQLKTLSTQIEEGVNLSESDYKNMLKMWQEDYTRIQETKLAGQRQLTLQDAKSLKELYRRGASEAPTTKPSELAPSTEKALALERADKLAKQKATSDIAKEKLKAEGKEGVARLKVDDKRFERALKIIDRVSKVGRSEADLVSEIKQLNIDKKSTEDKLGRTDSEGTPLATKNDVDNIQKKIVAAEANLATAKREKERFEAFLTTIKVTPDEETQFRTLFSEAERGKSVSRATVQTPDSETTVTETPTSSTVTQVSYVPEKKTETVRRVSGFNNTLKNKLKSATSAKQIAVIKDAIARLGILVSAINSGDVEQVNSVLANMSQSTNALEKQIVGKLGL